MAKLPTWEAIVGSLEVEVGYLTRRCLKAEGKDPDDFDALREIVGAAQDAGLGRVRNPVA